MKLANLHENSHTGPVDDLFNENQLKLFINPGTQHDVIATPGVKSAPN